MLDALVFANKPRAGDRPVLGRSAAARWIPAIEIFGDGFEPLDRLGLEPAVRQFLDAVGEPVFEEAPVIGRRLGLEQIAPFLLQRADRRGFQSGQLGQNCIGQSEPPRDVRTSA